jgi:hypothetical protein
MASKAREDRWFLCMTLLRRHMLKCAQCKGAVKAGTTASMCLRGMRLTVNAAHEFDAILDLKKAAHQRNDGFFYPCPDVSVHGKAYALAAQPHYGRGVQTGLF